VLVIAHRGASADQPENTLAAFDLAVRQGADWIETDLHLTRDGVVALLHDADLARIGGCGVVGETDWADLQRLDLGKGERVPSLDTALDRIGGGAAWNLELKVGPHGRYHGLEAEVLRAAESRGLAARVVLSSFRYEVLTTLRRYQSRARLGVLVGARWGAAGVAIALRRARRLGAVSIHPALGLVTPRRIRCADRRGLAVYPYTADCVEEWRRLEAAGAHGIFTNRPGALRAFLEARGRPLEPPSASPGHSTRLESPRG
jgi:glycerophosphoryl diester phosphodiesterase